MENSGTSEAKSVLLGVLAALGIMFLAVTGVFASAVPMRQQAANANTITCVAIGTGTWTACPTTASASRQDLWISNASTNTYIGTTDNTVAISTGITPIVIGPKSILHLPLNGTVNTYFRSLDGNVGNICTDEQTY